MHCNYLWNQIAVDAFGKIKPCCRFREQNSIGNIKQDLLGVINSAKYKWLRHHSMSGSKIQGCITCDDAEYVGIPSLRELANKETKTPDISKSHVDLDSIEYLHVSLGNLCNLKCMTCSPEYSSRWRKDYEILGWDTYGVAPHTHINTHWHEIFKQLPKLKSLRIVGGEPFIIPQHEVFLKSLLKSYEHSLHLSYFTNGTVRPQSSIVALWQKIGAVRINFSVDAVGLLANYIRYPSKWEKIEENLVWFINLCKKFSFVRTRIHTSVSILNLYAVQHLKNYLSTTFSSYKQSFDHRAVLIESPEFLSIKTLPRRIKEHYIENGDISEFKLFLSRHISAENQWDEFKQYIHSLDRIRKVNGKELLPYFYFNE